MLVRLATEADLVAAGEVTVAAYADFTLGPADPYIERLRDTASRLAEAELWVAEDGGRIVGTVTRCPHGSPWREIARDDEGEFRMLAVDPRSQGLGAGRALVSRVLASCRASGDRAVVMSSLPQMAAAHRLYSSLGFVRLPERDWSPLVGTDLIAFALDLRSTDHTDLRSTDHTNP